MTALFAKRIVSVLLLCFVAASVSAIIVKKTGKKPPAPAVAPTASEAGSVPLKPHHFIAYYLHGAKRCITCIKLEKLCSGAIHRYFGDMLRSGEMVYRMADYDTDEHNHFLNDFDLFAQSLVIIEMVDGKMTRWVKLDKIWDLLNDKDAFFNYVRDEATAFIRGR